MSINPELALYLSFMKRQQKRYKKTIDHFASKPRFEIYTTILEIRTEQILDKIIGVNQTASIKNRNILHILVTIQDIIDVSKRVKIFLSYHFSS